MVGQRYAAYFLEHSDKQAFGDLHHFFFLVDKTHFKVDLRKLGLTVGAQILVAEATGNLVVTVHAADHKQLFVLLRTLRQRVETAGVNTAWHKVVARAFRAGTTKHRGFDFKEAALVQVITCDFANLAAKHKVLLQLLTSEIDVTILKAQHFVGVFVTDGKRSRFRFGQDFQLFGNYFHFARFHVGVYIVACATAHLAHYGNYVFQFNSARLFQKFVRANVGVEYNLHNAAAVAQLQENKSAEVATTVHPTHQGKLVSDVAG